MAHFRNNRGAPGTSFFKQKNLMKFRHSAAKEKTKESWKKYEQSDFRTSGLQDFRPSCLMSKNADAKMCKTVIFAFYGHKA